MNSSHQKVFDLKGFADGFREAFDLRGFAEGFREAFDLGDAARSFAEGVRDGANLVRRQMRRAVAWAGFVEERHDATRGQLLLQRLLADVAGGGGSAVRALGEIRGLLRPFNPEIDRIPDDHIPGIVRRLIEDLQKPAARPEDFSGAVRAALAEAQAKAAALAFADAAQVLDEALAQTTAEDQERARGRAALLAERGRVARLQLRYREAAEFYHQAADAAFDEPLVRAHRLEAASAYYAQGEEFGDNAALCNAIAVYRAVLDTTPRKRMPLDWAATQNNLGNALARLGERESGPARLEEAVAAYCAALEERTRDRVPHDWAMTQNNLGNALQALGVRESGPARLEEAVAAYRAALDEFTREQAPLQWAMTQNNLGNAVAELGAREGDAARLEEAVVAYRSALGVRTRERVPLQWATTQNNLGHAFWRLGILKKGSAHLFVHLEEAMASFRAALTERTRERAPNDWAMTQNNLGIALHILGEREGNAAQLEEAIAAYRAALEVYTFERVPFEWAKTQNNLGIALELLGERESSPARHIRLQEAVAAFDAALAVFVEGGADRYAEGCRDNRARVIRLLDAE